LVTLAKKGPGKEWVRWKKRRWVKMLRNRVKLKMRKVAELWRRGEGAERRMRR
jgi:hypothetical protein